MSKRSRLRSDGRGKGRLLLMLVPAGIGLLLGLHFFVTPDNIAGERQGAEEVSGAGILLDNRGTIFDRNFKELAVTLNKVSVYADVRDVDVEEVAAALSPVFDMEPTQVEQIIGREHYRAWLAKNISQEKEEDVAALGLQGIYVHRERARYYPEKETAAHVVGYMGKSIGLAGVEYSYNALLNRYGAAARASVDYSADYSIETETQATAPDRYLVLTLDLKIQKILENLAAELGGKRENIRIAALLMECETGKIIGEAGYPSFDPNSFQDYSPAELDNILAQQVVVPETIGNLFWNASLIQSHFEQSGDVLPWSVYSPVRSLGSQLRLWDRLGLNDPLDVDFIKHVGQTANTAEKPRNIMDTSHFDSMAERTTPLHLAAAINGLTRGGRQPVPHLIERIAAGDGKVLRLHPGEREQAVAPPVAAEVLRMLQEQMEEGPLSSGFLETGALSFHESDKGRGYNDSRMFVSLIPRDKPEFMLFVFAQLPTFSPSPAKTKGVFSISESAHGVTIPLVAMQKVMSNLSDMMTAEEQNEMNFQLQNKIGKSVMVADAGKNGAKDETYGAMPDLKGLSLRKSLRNLQDLRLEIQISGTGVVVEQMPPAGRLIKHGELCRLVLKPH